MPLISLSFVLFTGIVLVLYLAVTRGWQVALLLTASYLFSLSFSVPSLVALLAVTILNFGIPKLFTGRSSPDRILLIVGIAANVAAIGLFKYSDALLGRSTSVLAALGFEIDPSLLSVLAPIGLSFYVLQGISYLIDVYRGQLSAKVRFTEFGLYMAYFPKLLAGPIESSREFIPTLQTPRMVDNRALSHGFALIVLGLFRKVVIADPLFWMVPDRALRSPGDYTGPTLILFMATYIFALYNDFAGYTDIARGISQLFGIRLSKNFRQPFFSRSFSELFTRWHATLTAWLTGYIYLPLTRTLMRLSRSPRSLHVILVPPIITFMVSGLWHNASPGMLLWGFLLGLLMAIERLFSLWRPAIPPDQQPIWRQAAGTLIVFVLALFVMVPFVVGFEGTLAYWRGMLRLPQPIDGDIRITILIAVTLGIDAIQRLARDELVFLRWPRPAQAALLSLSIVAIFLASRSDISDPFIYQGF